MNKWLWIAVLLCFLGAALGLSESGWTLRIVTVLLFTVAAIVAFCIGMLMKI